MPGTTPNGFPYPLPTEPVSEGPTTIQALAKRADDVTAAQGVTVASLTGRMSATEGNVGELTTRVAANEAQVTENEADVTELDTRVTAAEGSIVSLDGRVTTLEESGGGGGGNLPALPPFTQWAKQSVTGASGQVSYVAWGPYALIHIDLTITTAGAISGTSGLLAALDQNTVYPLITTGITGALAVPWTTSAPTGIGGTAVATQYNNNLRIFGWKAPDGQPNPAGVRVQGLLMYPRYFYP